jgi:hypothetical protein
MGPSGRTKCRLLVSLSAPVYLSLASAGVSAPISVGSGKRIDHA